MSSINSLQDVLNESTSGHDSVEPLDMTLWPTYQYLAGVTTKPGMSWASLDKRWKTAAILFGVIALMWLLGRLHSRARQAHHATAGNLGAQGIATAAVGA